MKFYNGFNKPLLDADDGNGGGGGKEHLIDPSTLSFDDFLKLNDFQAEFDRRNNKSIETNSKNWQTKFDAEKERLKSLYDGKLTEAEKLAKMNEEEKEKYLKEQKDAEWKKREAEITKRELTADAKAMLAEKNLSTDLVDLIVFDSADSVKDSIEKIEKVVNAEVQKMVEERLKGGEPPKDSSTQGDGDKKTVKSYKDLVGLTYQEIAELKAKDPEGFAKISE